MARFLTGGIDSITTTPNQPQFQIQVITITIAGTPVNLPSIPIPDGVEFSLKAKESNTINSRIYIANSSANTSDLTKRLELKRGEAIALNITNTNLIWIDSNVSDSKIELIVEA